MQFEELTTIDSETDLMEYYRAVSSPDLRLGIEWERSGIHRDTLRPVQYREDGGYLAILKKLVSEAGWEITDGHRDKIYELKRGNALVTLEADGRLELASSAKLNLHDLAREFRIHANEVHEVSDFFNVGWLPTGWQPFHKNSEVKLLKKKRYHFLGEHFEKKAWESDMKHNNGLTSNFSYLDEANAIRKAQIAFRILPIVGAMFASAPLESSVASGFLDLRRRSIFQYAPQRNKMPSNILDADFSFQKWIEHYLELPVILITRPGRADIDVKDKLTFRQWIKKGHLGIFPTFRDFDQHIKSVWSDIRLRPGYLEYRVADSVPFKLAMSVPALVKGLIFDSTSWRTIEKLTKKWTYSDIVETDKEAWKSGLKTEIGGKNLLWYAKQIIEISNDALHKFDNTQAVDHTQDESVYLAPLKEQIFIKEVEICLFFRLVPLANSPNKIFHIWILKKQPKSKIHCALKLTKES